MRRRSAGRRVPVRVFEHHAVDFDVRFVRGEQACDDVDERRLAAARAAEQADDAGSRDLDRHVERESVATLQGADAEHAIVSARAAAARAAR